MIYLTMGKYFAERLFISVYQHMRGETTLENRNQQNGEMEIDLLKLAMALLRRLPIIIVATVVCAALGFASRASILSL